MNEAYTKLMLQQHISKDADAAFYEKLENSGKLRKPVWKAAVAAACILLLIPVTVLAADYSFSTAKMTQSNQPMADGKPGVGLDVQYESIETYNIKDFPEYLQTLEESEVIYHDSLAEAEEYLGIDLVDNALLTAEDTKQISRYRTSWKEQRKHCSATYSVVDGQLHCASIQAAYERNDIGFEVKSTIYVEHPSSNKEYLANNFHGRSITILESDQPNIHTEQYTTPSGIPVLIVTVVAHATNSRDILVDYCAYFAVNNISYEISMTDWSFGNNDTEFMSAEEKIMVTIQEVLEGFTLN